MIITIGREHGSNGHLIARALAEELGYVCFDKEIVDTAAEKSSFSKEILNSYDEKRVSPYIVPVPHYLGLNESFRLNMQVASAQFDAIRSLAERDNCIFVGRCADYVLRDHPSLLRVFIYADKQDRLNRIVNEYGQDPKNAESVLNKIDKGRANYHKFYTGTPWRSLDNYDLCVNTSVVGITGAVMAIKAAAEEKFGLKK